MYRLDQLLNELSDRRRLCELNRVGQNEQHHAVTQHAPAIQFDEVGVVAIADKLMSTRRSLGCRGWHNNSFIHRPTVYLLSANIRDVASC